MKIYGLFIIETNAYEHTGPSEDFITSSDSVDKLVSAARMRNPEINLNVLGESQDDLCDEFYYFDIRELKFI